MRLFVFRSFLCAAILNFVWKAELVSGAERADDECNDCAQYRFRTNDNFDVDSMLESDAEIHHVQLLQTELQLHARGHAGSAATVATSGQVLDATRAQTGDSASYERNGQAAVYTATSVLHPGTDHEVLSTATIGRGNTSHALSVAPIGRDNTSHTADPFGVRQQVLAFTKQVRAPEEKWAVAALVALSFLFIVALSLSCWLWRNTKKEDKPTCSLGLKITTGFFAIVFYIAGTYLTTWYFAGAVLQKAISSADTAFLGVKVGSERMALNPFVGKLIVDGLRIENPQGYTSDHLLTCKNLLIDISMRSVIFSLAHRLTIQRLDLDGCDVIYERSLTTSNVEDVIHHLEGGSGSHSHDGGTAKPKVQVSAQEVTIQNLWAKGTLYLLGNNGISLAIPNMHWDDFTKEQSGRNSGEEIASFLLATILNSVLRVFNR